MKANGIYIAAVGVLLAGVFAAANKLTTSFSAFPPLARRPTTPPNLILISIDTLRADRIGCYGYSRNTTPEIDKLAKQGVLFKNTVSVSSWTLPSHVSMLSGLYPTTHGVTRDRNLKIGSDTTLLSEILKEHRYHTYGFTGGNYVGKHYGFDRGFDKYRNTDKARRKGKRGLANSILKLKKTLSSIKDGRPYFVFLHTFDVHCPYDPPEPYYSLFQSPEAEKIAANQCGKTFYNKRKLSSGQVKYISDRYDGSIRWVDSNLKSLFEFLKERGDFKNTFIILTSDHGEEFFEHGRIGHQQSLYRELLMVPLIIAGPGLKPARIESMTSIADIFPTALELLNLPVPEDSQGLSLVSAMMGDPSKLVSRKFIASELDRRATLRSRMDASEHFITDLRSSTDYLFDIKADPVEQKNLAPNPRAKEYSRELLGFLAHLERQTPATGEEKSKEQLESLQSLGYM